MGGDEDGRREGKVETDRETMGEMSSVICRPNECRSPVLSCVEYRECDVTQRDAADRWI